MYEKAVRAMPGSFMAETSDGTNPVLDMFAWHWFMITRELEESLARVADLYNDDARVALRFTMADADPKNTFLSPAVISFLRRRLLEALGISLISVGLIMLVMLLSHGRYDPSFGAFRQAPFRTGSALLAPWWQARYGQALAGQAC